MDVVARLRYLRIAPRKVRLALDLIRGKNLQLAEDQLRYLPKRASVPLLKLLKSAQANAENNFKLDPTTLFIKQAYADEGPKLKRYRPRAMGRASLIMKRSSHVTVVLSPTASSVEKSQAQKEAKPLERQKQTVKGLPAQPKVPLQQRFMKRIARASKRSKTIQHPGEKMKD